MEFPPLFFTKTQVFSFFHPWLLSYPWFSLFPTLGCYSALGFPLFLILGYYSALDFPLLPTLGYYPALGLYSVGKSSHDFYICSFPTRNTDRSKRNLLAELLLTLVVIRTPQKLKRESFHIITQRISKVAAKAKRMQRLHHYTTYLYSTSKRHTVPDVKVVPLSRHSRTP